MMRLIAFLSLVLAVTAQWQQQQQSYQPQPYQHQQQSSSHHGSNPAPVHYVSIGAQLQGDYKFGYNTGNGGSFREETRLPDGSVQGAYGYIDASGQQKVIKYTAGKDGFKAEGDDIPKAPPAPQQPAHPAAPSYHHQPQPAYQAPQHNYVPQGPAQQYGAPQYNSYNPQNYGNPGQPHGNQLSYNIGGGNQYQG